MTHFQLSHLGPKCEHNKGSTYSVLQSSPRATCPAPGDHCDRCGRSSQRIYNCQSCLQSGFLLSCLAPNTENYHISPPACRHPALAPLYRDSSHSPSWSSLYTVHRQPTHVTQKPPAPARNWGQLKPSNRNGIILLIQSVTRVLSLWMDRHSTLANLVRR